MAKDSTKEDCTMIEARLRELKEAVLPNTDVAVMRAAAQALIQAIEQSRVGEVDIDRACDELNIKVEYCEQMDGKQGTLYLSPEVKP